MILRCHRDHVEMRHDSVTLAGWLMNMRAMQDSCIRGFRALLHHERPILRRSGSGTEAGRTNYVLYYEDYVTHERFMLEPAEPTNEQVMSRSHYCITSLE